MNRSKTGRTVAFVVLGLALLSGAALVVILLLRDPAPVAGPQSGGELVVQTGRNDDIQLDEKQPLRCFVDGKSIGELALAECARRNGVAPGALGVGLDPSGSLAAANGPSSQITPLPPKSGPDDTQVARAATPEAVASNSPPALSAQPSACWRYDGASWEREPQDLGLAACVEQLFAGDCDPGDSPVYGRWDDRALRLVGGRVEISADNRNFHLLAAHAPGCAAPGQG